MCRSRGGSSVGRARASQARGRGFETRPPLLAPRVDRRGGGSRGSMGFLGRFGVRIARRSRWLAARLWLVAAVEIAWITRSHWRRLEPEERSRLLGLVRKSRFRPSRLSNSERREAAELLEKIDYAHLGGTIAATLLRFRPLGRFVEFELGRPARARRRAAAAES